MELKNGIKTVPVFKGTISDSSGVTGGGKGAGGRVPSRDF